MSPSVESHLRSAFVESHSAPSAKRILVPNGKGNYDSHEFFPGKGFPPKDHPEDWQEFLEAVAPDERHSLAALFGNDDIAGEALAWGEMTGYDPRDYYRPDTGELYQPEPGFDGSTGSTTAGVGYVPAEVVLRSRKTTVFKGAKGAGRWLKRKGMK